MNITPDIDRRAPGRRSSDLKREMLEDSMKELPKYFVTVLDQEKGLYSFYYTSRKEAQEMVDALTGEGIDAEAIAVYQRI